MSEQFIRQSKLAYDVEGDHIAVSSHLISGATMPTVGDAMKSTSSKMRRI